MSYLVCYKCDVYYEVETEEEIREFTHCECGEKLVFFEKLEDSYTEPESVYEALEEADGAYIDLDEVSGNNKEPENVGNQHERDYIKRNHLH